MIVTSPEGAVIQDIVMHQTGCVDHLCNFRKPSMPLCDITAGSLTCISPQNELLLWLQTHIGHEACLT